MHIFIMCEWIGVIFLDGILLCTIRQPWLCWKNLCRIPLRRSHKWAIVVSCEQMLTATGRIMGKIVTIYRRRLFIEENSRPYVFPIITFFPYLLFFFSYKQVSKLFQHFSIGVQLLFNRFSILPWFSSVVQSNLICLALVFISFVLPFFQVFVTAVGALFFYN